MLPSSKPHHHPPPLRQPFIHRKRRLIIRPAALIQDLNKQKITRLPAPEPSNPLHPRQLPHQPLPLLNDPLQIPPHDSQTTLAQRAPRQRARRAADVVRGLEAIEEARDGLAGEGDAEADASEPKGLAEGLHDDEVIPLGNPLGEAGALGREVDVSLVDDDDAVPGGVLEDGLDLGPGDQRAGGVAGGADVDELDGGVGGEGGGDGGDVEGEFGGGGQRHLDEADVVDLRGDAVHAVGGGADEDLIAGGDAETAQQGVDGLVAPDAHKQVCRADGLGSVGVGVAEGAEEGLQVVLVRVGVAVEAEEVDLGGGRGGDGGEGERRAVGILVGVEEDVGAVVFVVAG